MHKGLASVSHFVGQLFTVELKYTYTKIVHVIITDHWNQTARLYESQVTVIYSRAVLVIVTLECHVKRVICKTWTGTLANSADPYQISQNAASDQGLHCLLKVQEFKG